MYDIEAVYTLTKGANLGIKMSLNYNLATIPKSELNLQNSNFPNSVAKKPTNNT